MMMEGSFEELVTGQTKLMRIIFTLTIIKATILACMLVFSAATFNILKYNQALMEKMQPKEILHYIDAIECAK